MGGNYFKNEGYREDDYEHRIRGNLGLRYRFKKVQGLSVGLSASAMYIDQADFLLWQNADSGAYSQNPLATCPPVRDTGITLIPMWNILPGRVTGIP